LKEASGWVAEERLDGDGEGRVDGMLRGSIRAANKNSTGCEIARGEVYPDESEGPFGARLELVIERWRASEQEEHAGHEDSAMTYQRGKPAAVR
jgi:hypothetical protein